MKLYPTGDICRMLRIPEKTLDNWCRMGIVRPTMPGGGHGRHRVFSKHDIFSLAVCYWARTSGFTLPAVKAIGKILISITDEKLHSEFKKGNTCLLIAGDDVMPMLVSQDTISHNSRLRRVYEDAKRKGLTAVPLGINLLPISNQLEILFARLEEEKQGELATSRTC